MKRRLWVRIGIWVSIGLVALIIVAFTAGRPLLNKRARALVVKTLAHHADEKALEKLSVELDILQGDLVVHDLEVEPVPSATSQDKAVLSFSAPRLEFDVSLWRLLIGRLHLTSIRLDRPIIRIDDVAHVKHAEGFDIQHMVRKMRQGLSGYLSSVGISNLTVEQAKLIYRRTTAAGTWEFELNGLDLELAGLQIDEALLDTPERMALEELRIGLGAHEFTTPKGNIHARLDRLDISFARRSIDILGLRMEIAANTTKVSEPKGAPMRVSLDGFHMHGIDLHPASSSDTLVAERIILDRPMVTLELQNHAPHHGLDTTSRLASVLSEFVPQQRLDTLDIRNGALHLTQEQGRSLGIEHINVHIVELHGSTALVGNGFDVRPPRAGNIHVSGVSAKQHGVALELGSLAFDLSEGDLKGVDLRCAFDGGQRTGREELEVARFGVIGMDLVAYLKDRSVSMDSLYILGSEVNMAVQAKAPSAGKTDGAEEDIHLRLALDRLLEGTGSPILSIRNIEVQGEVKLRSADHGTLSGSLGRVAIHGTGFRFPEGKEEVHRLLYIDQLRVALNDLILDEQASGIRFTAGSVDARTGQHGIIVDRPTIHMQGRRASDLSAGRIELIGLDYVALLERRGIFLDRILLDGADLEIDLPEHRPEADAKAPVASALLKHVHAKDIELRSRTLRLRKQGELLVQVDSFYYRCRDLRADPEAWTPTNMAFRRDALQYGGRRLRLAPPGSGITGSVKAFDIDMINDHALMTELDLLVNRPGLQATLRIPSISSSDFDPHFIDRTNVIALGRLVIHGPEIALQLHEETPPTSADGTHRKPAAPSPYRGVHARSIALRNGTVELALDRGENSVEARIMDLNTMLADLNVQVDTTDQPLRTGPVTVEAGRIDVLSGDHADSTLTTLDLFMALNAATMDGTGNYVAEGLRFGAKQVSAPLPGGMHVTTGSLDYSPQEERLEVENIHYAPIASQAGFATDRPYRADAIVLDVDRVRIFRDRCSEHDHHEKVPRAKYFHGRCACQRPTRSPPAHSTLSLQAHAPSNDHGPGAIREDRYGPGARSTCGLWRDTTGRHRSDPPLLGVHPYPEHQVQVRCEWATDDHAHHGPDPGTGRVLGEHGIRLRPPEGPVHLSLLPRAHGPERFGRHVGTCGPYHDRPRHAGHLVPGGRSERRRGDREHDHVFQEAALAVAGSPQRIQRCVPGGGIVGGEFADPQRP